MTIATTILTDATATGTGLNTGGISDLITSVFVLLIAGAAIAGAVYLFKNGALKKAGLLLVALMIVLVIWGLSLGDNAARLSDWLVNDLLFSGLDGADGE